MKRLFLLAVLGLVVFEFAKVYFVMPLPYSQRVRSIDVAFALHTWRWPVRALLGATLLFAFLPSWRVQGWRRWITPLGLLIVGATAYVTNVVMAADHVFRLPSRVTIAAPGVNAVAQNRLVVGIEVNGVARAYPIEFVGYHHQVRDTVGGENVLVTFCTVCRTGRVFSPVMNGREEQFRLVGMDHFNAMLEDRSSGSWWRQATGEAIAGARKGETLREIPSRQVTLAQWLELHPNSGIMQADSTMRERYPKNFDYETGMSRSALTGTDTVSWSEKAWVIGLTVNGQSKAYDWNRLRRERVINDVLGGTPVVVLIALDNASYFAFERPDSATRFTLRGDSLIAPTGAYGLSGRGAAGLLAPLQASQEFWHSWRTFQPGTGRY